MGVGGYAGGLLFDIYLNYVVSFMLAGAAGVLNLAAIAAMLLMGGNPRHGLPVAP
jgi:hypothetical protein